MKFAKKIIVAFLVVVFTLVLHNRSAQSEAGPSSTPDMVGDESLHKRVAILVSDLKNPFFVSMVNGAKNAAAIYGMELIVKDAQNSDSRQLVDVADLCREPVDIIIVNPTNDEAIVPGIDLANTHNIPVITLDRESADGEILCHVASDNREGGRMAARLLAKHLNNRGRIVELEGIPGTSAAYARGAGFNEELKNFGQLMVVARQVARFDRNEAFRVIGKIIDSGLEFDGVFAHNDNMILGVADALAARNIKVPGILVGFDGIKEAKVAVKTKKITATIAQEPEMMGKISVDTAARFFRGGKIPPRIFVTLSTVEK